MKKKQVNRNTQDIPLEKDVQNKKKKKDHEMHANCIGQLNCKPSIPSNVFVIWQNCFVMLHKKQYLFRTVIINNID